MHVIGLDIGGANLKAAHNDGLAVSQPFPLWKQPEHLSRELGHLCEAFPKPDRFAVTMTAELCDCFQSKAHGVDHVLSAVEQVAGRTPISVWQTGGEFIPPDVARDIPRLVAAANWHALATFCGRSAPDDAALLLDVGSTTTDVIPLLHGIPVPSGLTDIERLKSEELVYSGVRRTPLCALTSEVSLNGTPVGVAAELFATTLDVYLLLKDIPENPRDRNTADGRPATRSAATNRLARMLCTDDTEFSPQEIHSLAGQFAAVQQQKLIAAMQRVVEPFPAPCRYVLFSGCGEFLARRAAENVPALQSADWLSLSAMLTPQLAEAACAFAVAKLAAERC